MADNASEHQHPSTQDSDAVRANADQERSVEASNADEERAADQRDGE